MTTPTGPENVYGYLVSYLEMRRTFLRHREEKTIPEHQAAVYQVLQGMLNGMRRKYRELPEEQKSFYLGMTDEEKLMFEAIVIDYGKKETEANELKRNEKNSKDQIRTLQKELDQKKDEIERLKKDLKNAEAKEEQEHAKLEKLKESHAYRFGRLLTWPFRVFRSLLKKKTGFLL